MKPLSIGVTAIGLIAASASVAQTRSVRDTATTYGARLNAKGQPAGLNQNRVNNRVDSRIGSRLSLRIERYRPESTNPIAAFETVPDDKSRTTPVIAPPTQQDD